MELRDILEKCSQLRIHEKRSVDEDYCELVCFNREMDQWGDIISGLLGPPRKPRGQKPNQGDLELTQESGGIRIEQTLFEKDFENVTVVAKFWPWQDEVHTTLRIALLKNMKTGG